MELRYEENQEDGVLDAEAQILKQVHRPKTHRGKGLIFFVQTSVIVFCMLRI